MVNEVRQGLGLLFVAAAFLLVSLAATGDAYRLTRAAGALFGLIALVAIAIGLLRAPRD